MTHRRQKLELTWIDKENRPRLEPRILLEDPAHSYHATDQFDNRLNFSDNMSALKQAQQWQNCRSSATTICYLPDDKSILMEVDQ